MALESCGSTRTLARVVFNPLGEEVDCEHLPDSDLIVRLAGIKRVRARHIDGGDPDEVMKAVADAMRGLMEKGDVVFDYDRNFRNENADLQSAVDNLYDLKGMHVLVGRSADRSTLFVVFAPTRETQCVVIG
jgi:hypothetical protein